MSDETLFALPPDSCIPRESLVELTNQFGWLGGFRLLLERLQSCKDRSVMTIHTLIRPLGMCCELLTEHAVKKYTLPILEIVPTSLEKLSYIELKKDADEGSLCDALSSIVEALKKLAGRASRQDTVRSLEVFRLKMILRLLQMPSFNGKMDALNMVNKEHWQNATKQQRECLLELMVQLAEDDRDGVMAPKLLDQLWSLAHSDDVPTEIMEQALSAQVKILKNNSSKRAEWLERCIQELKSDKWVLPALKQIRNICCLYECEPQQGSSRLQIIRHLQDHHSLLDVLMENIKVYMEKIQDLARIDSNIDVNTYCPDGRYSHMQQIQEWLDFVFFCLKDGKRWLLASQAHQIWSCLAEKAVLPSDREACFKFFSDLMSVDPPHLYPDDHEKFFRENILQLDPWLVIESGFRCFDTFFKTVNKKAGRLLPKRCTSQMEGKEPIGLDYLWRVTMNGGNDITNMAIDLLRETYTSLGQQLLTSQTPWENATKQQRERLLELFVRFAEDDNSGVMVPKVLDLLWSLAHSDNVPTETMEQALSEHVKILKNNSSQRAEWLERCGHELKSDKWMLPALKLMRNICCLYEEEHTQDNPQHGLNRRQIIKQLQSQHGLIEAIITNLLSYMERIRTLARTNSNIDVNAYCSDGRYNHLQQVQERLNFLRFVLKDGGYYLVDSQPHKIWSCLAEKAVFPSDREACFKFFSDLMSLDPPHLYPNTHEKFFREDILQLDPSLLTESGFRCFDKLFKVVNKKAGRLASDEYREPIGLDYLWRVTKSGDKDVASMAKELLRETQSDLGSQPQTEQECGICLKPWSSEVRRALVPACGHASGCLACLKQLQATAGREHAVCPFCREPFNEPPKEVFM